MTASNIMQQMNACLPCEVQQLILKHYTQKYIFSELFTNSLLHITLRKIQIDEKIIHAISQYVNKVCFLYQHAFNAFDMCIDVLEERLLEDELINNIQQIMHIIHLTRIYVATPKILEVEIIRLKLNLFQNNKNGMQSFLKNIIMMEKML